METAALVGGDRRSLSRCGPLRVLRPTTVNGPHQLLLTPRQLLDRQIRTLPSAGCSRIFADKDSGKRAEGEELWKALD